MKFKIISNHRYEWEPWMEYFTHGEDGIVDGLDPNAPEWAKKECEIFLKEGEEIQKGRTFYLKF